MGSKSWIIRLDGDKHIVELEHGYWSGKIVVKVDGEKIDESSVWSSTGTERRFEINEHPCILRLIPHAPLLVPLINWEYELYVDGHLV